MMTERRATSKLPVLRSRRSVTTPPTVSPMTPAKSTPAENIAEDCKIQMIVLEEKRRNPAQEQPQRPAVAEVDHRYRQMRRASRSQGIAGRLAPGLR